MQFTLTTPVAFFIFNRPKETFRVFSTIREVKPQKLLIIADGARSADEEEKCENARSIIEKIDWDCEIFTNLSNTNLGCKVRVSSGLDWVFSIVESAIILEDDCLPQASFYRFCSELLIKYSDDERVMAISGNNFQFGKKRTKNSYYFSVFPHCWGWATWRRAWQHYDIDMKLWPMIRDNNWLMDILHSKEDVKFWKNIFQNTFDNLIDTWAHRWTFNCWIQSGLTILPNVNLVSNIGFDCEATHTKKSDDQLSKMNTEELTFPLSHPQFIIRDFKSDKFTQNKIFCPKISNLIKLKTKNLIKRLKLIVK